MEKATITVRGPKEPRKITDLLGKFAQKNFYMDLMESMIREMFRAAALAFAAAITTTITKQITSDRTPVQQLANPVPNDGGDLSRRAFGGGDPRYGGGYNNNGYNNNGFPPSPPKNASFPGFGS